MTVLLDVDVPGRRRAACLAETIGRPPSFFGYFPLHAYHPERERKFNGYFARMCVREKQ
jgi:hypothetical protein